MAMEQQQLGPYRLLNRLGRGGMGAVYEAIDEQTGDAVAVKILATHLADDPGLRQRFEAEIETLKPLRCNGIVHLLAYGEQDGQPYFAMELVRGKSLAGQIKSKRTFSWQQTIALASDIVRALKVAHDHGIIHRDLKPANLLVADDVAAAGTTVKLADFGIARLFGAAGQTAHGSIVGTAEFMAPEQAAGKPVDARADLYALGLVMFTMLTGKPPFRGAQLTEIITRQLREKPPQVASLVADVPAELNALIDQLLEKDPRDRPASALAVGRRLTAIAAAAASDTMHTRKPAAGVAGEPEVVVREQAAPSTSTSASMTAATQGKSPVNQEAATRDATILGGRQDALAETTELPHGGTADPLQQRSPPCPNDAGTAPTQELPPLSASAPAAPHEKAATQRATGRQAPSPTAEESHAAAADTVVDQARVTRFVTMADVDRANQEQQRRQHVRQQRIHVIVTLLTAGMAAAIAYLVLQPPTADQLYDRIAAVSTSDTGDLRDVRQQISQFLRVFPNDPRVAEVAALDQTIKVDMLEKRARRRVLGDRSLPAIERDYRAALAQEAESPTAALEAFRAVKTLHQADAAESLLPSSDHATWLALIERQLARLELRAAEEQVTDHERAGAILAEAAALANKASADPEQGQDLLAARRRLLKSLVTTYGDRPHVAAEVAIARELLATEVAGGTGVSPSPTSPAASE